MVLNFGATERVFNQWNSFEVIHDATNIGGVIYCVLPMSAYLHHSFYCYTPLFFHYLAASNDYEMLDLFTCPAGVNNIRKLGLDIRQQINPGKSRSEAPIPDDDRLLQFDIHAIMRKTSNLHFRTGMDVATAHSAVDPRIRARYISNTRVTERQRLEEELAIMRRSTSWKVTAPLRAIGRMLG